MLSGLSAVAPLFGRQRGRAMNEMRALVLMGSNGRPIDHRIERVLAGLIPKLRRRFPSLQDEVVLIEIVEDAGRRIAAREERNGPIGRLHGYAWVTMRSVATSYLRRPATRLVQRTLEPEASESCLARTATSYGAPEEVERGILLREALETLSPEERMVCLWKTAGFTSQEIAALQGRSVGAVDTSFSRAKQRIRHALAPPESRAASVAPKRRR